MSKAVLVIDMPRDGLSCKVGYYDDEQGEVHCPIMDCVCDEWEVPDWCPLIPEPERRHTITDSVKLEWYIKGYNACIDAIEGREE